MQVSPRAAEGGVADAAEPSSDDVYFAPADAATLDPIFSALTACAELWPDAEEGGDGESSGEMPAWAAALLAGGAPDGAAPGQFDDA